MGRENWGGIFKHFRRVLSSGTPKGDWESLIEAIERSYQQKRFDQLEQHLEHALTFLREQPRDPDRAMQTHRLAEYFEQYGGNFKRSEQLYREAIELFEEQAPNDPFQAAAPLNSLAVLLIHQRRYPEAEPLIRRLLPIVERQLGKQHIEYATCLENLAAVLRNTGQDEEAGDLRQQASLIRQQHRRQKTS